MKKFKGGDMVKMIRAMGSMEGGMKGLFGGRWADYLPPKSHF